MRNIAKLVTLGAIVALGGGLLAAQPALAQGGKVPSDAECKAEPKDAVTQGGCVVLNRRKGNCMACHMMPGVPYGNVAPPLTHIKQRFPDKAKLRAQIWDATAFNPDSAMPPFGKHGILSEDEIDKVVEFLYTL